MRMRVVKGPISEPAPISTKQCPSSDSCVQPIARQPIDLFFFITLKPSVE